MPVITIGLSFYNNVATLESAIKSVFAQTFGDWELVLVDDGSSDGSIEIANAIKDRRVRLVQDGENLGLPSRLNQIAGMARGDYLARMDADDLMHPLRLEKQLKLLVTRPSVDVVGTGMVTINNIGVPVGLHIPANQAFNARRVFTKPVLVHASVMGQTKWFREHPYDPSFRRAQDRELWARTFRDSQFYTMDEPLMFVREQGKLAASKYGHNCAARRRILRAYGFQSLGKVEVVSLLGLTYFKQWAYYFLSVINKVDVAISKRNQTLNSTYVREAEETIALIQSLSLLEANETVEWCSSSIERTKY